MEILSLVLSVVFLSLGLVHLNWAMGGELGFANALPTDEQGKRILNPLPMHSAIVGSGLLLFACFYIFQSNLINIDLPHWITTIGSWMIPSIFMLRAIGDFKYVGFFRAIRNTTFGKYDSKFYSPLCLIIGLAGFIINLA